jgi:sucrose phosphorylase
MALLARTQVGRDINRHYYDHDEVLKALDKPVVVRLLDLIRLRNTHPAFQGQFQHASTADHLMTLTWTAANAHARLEVGLARQTGAIFFSGATQEECMVLQS